MNRAVNGGARRACIIVLLWTASLPGCDGWTIGSLSGKADDDHTTGPTSSSASAGEQHVAVQDYSSDCFGFDRSVNGDWVGGDVFAAANDYEVDFTCTQMCYFSDAFLPDGLIPVRQLEYHTNAIRPWTVQGVDWEIPPEGVIHTEDYYGGQRPVAASYNDDGSLDAWMLDAETSVAGSTGVSTALIDLAGEMVFASVSPPLHLGDFKEYAELDTDGDGIPDVEYSLDFNDYEGICNLLSPSAGGNPWGWFYAVMDTSDGSAGGSEATSDADLSGTTCTGTPTAYTRFMLAPMPGARMLSPNTSRSYLLTPFASKGSITYAGRDIEKIEWEANGYTDLVVAHNGEVYPLEGDEGEWIPPLPLHLGGNVAFYGTPPDGGTAALALPEITIFGTCADGEVGSGGSAAHSDSGPTRYALTADHLSLLGVPSGFLHEDIELNLRYYRAENTHDDVHPMDGLTLEIPFIEERGIAVNTELDGYFSLALRGGFDIRAKGYVNEDTSVSPSTLTVDITEINDNPADITLTATPRGAQ